MTAPVKISFSGHDSFACRSIWLKKGYDFVKNGNSFNSPDAVIALGVGKNMVTAIRYWMRAFNILDTDDRLTPLAEKLLADDGWDPYLEDEGSLWLLHYHLIKKEYATTFNLIFNELRKSKIEFSKDYFVKYVMNKFEKESSFKNTNNTVGADFMVFLKMYFSNPDAKEKEDIIGGVLTELKLLRQIKREKEEIYLIQDTDGDTLPDELIYYAIAENPAYGQSVSLHTIANDKNSLGAVFALNQTGIIRKLERLMEKYPEEIIFKDDAGVKEIQFRTGKKNPLTILEHYYHAH